MNTIAMQIEYATDLLRVTNDLLLARNTLRQIERERELDYNVKNRSYHNERRCNQMANVLRLERELDDMTRSAE